MRNTIEVITAPGTRILLGDKVRSVTYLRFIVKGDLPVRMVKDKPVLIEYTKVEYSGGYYEFFTDNSNTSGICIPKDNIEMIMFKQA